MRSSSTTGRRWLATLVLGLATVLGTIAWGHAALTPEPNGVPKPPTHATEEYGKRLVAQTTEILGPDVAVQAVLILFMCVIGSWFGISKAMSVRAQEVLS